MKKIIFLVVLVAFAGLLFSCNDSGSSSNGLALALLGQGDNNSTTGGSGSGGGEQGGGSGGGEQGGGETGGGGDETVIDTTVAISGTNVLLQGFNWSSNFHDRYYGDSYAENWVMGTSNSSAPNGSKDWYDVVKANADYIKGTFEYVWFPPATDSGSDNGYMPRKLNVLTSFYGTETELKSSISSLSPAKAICDIVINHRVGTSNWGTFTEPSFCADYYAICSDDEGFTAAGSDMYDSENKGEADTGEGYISARDLDHTNWDVQNGIVNWMTNKLKACGFVGWRYDYVKGFGGKYVGYYNARTSAEFSVGEHWPTDGFDYSNPAAWSDQFESWVASTSESIKTDSDDYSSMTETKIAGRDQAGSPSRVFDFVTKGMLNKVFGSNGSGIANSNYNLLANAYCGYKKMPESAVTFVDNHDTGSTQALWYLDPDDVGTAYAFILTHPGYPCVAWQHYFTAAESYDTTVSGNASQYIGGNTVPGTSLTYREFIYSLIKLRAEVGITDSSIVSVWDETDSSMYLAQVTGTNGTLVVNIGGAYDMTSNASADSYELSASGTNFKIWKNISE